MNPKMKWLNIEMFASKYKGEMMYMWLDLGCVNTFNI